LKNKTAFPGYETLTKAKNAIYYNGRIRPHKLWKSIPRAILERMAVQVKDNTPIKIANDK